ncbi:MAG TPA: ice-binding family protein [Archangium sp.]|uniref:ice-binding family protein n=1 Tax=Archangium sp. TaxID=1872627 RepID=UPI002E2FB155|nr:ice-binding family protein [Archangium sp.]HEX5745864.1 ice-binding family protein [Archangium sp.]
MALTFSAIFVTSPLAACGGTDDTGDVPTVSSSNPMDGASGVPLNAKVSVVFSRAMDPLSLTTSTFVVKQGSTPVSGTVAAGADGTTAIFTPTSSLAGNTVFTGVITAKARTPAGQALAKDHTWSFTTGATADTAPPEISATNPSNNGTGVAINAKITATFSKAMDPLTLKTSTFTVKQGTTLVPGTVAYGTTGTTAIFTPTSNLAGNMAFTAELSTGVLDLEGNPLARAFSWSFTTGTTESRGPAPVGLGMAGNYVVLAKTAISTVPPSAVTGNIAVSPAAATFITGFSLVADATNVFSTSSQLVGKAYAANYAVPTPSNLTTAISNMESAYSDAAGRPTPDFLELGTGNIGGMTLAPGLYKWTSTVTIPVDVVISGGANDVWIFQTTGDLTMDAGKKVTLSGGAQARNIFWQVAGKTTFGANSHFEGIVLSKTDITLQTGATMNGRALAQTQVALQQATVTQPAP